jgi:hypothetical protein
MPRIQFIPAPIDFSGDAGQRIVSPIMANAMQLADTFTTEIPKIRMQQEAVEEDRRRYDTSVGEDRRRYAEHQRIAADERGYKRNVDALSMADPLSAGYNDVVQGLPDGGLKMAATTRREAAERGEGEKFRKDYGDILSGNLSAGAAKSERGKTARAGLQERRRATGEREWMKEREAALKMFDNDVPGAAPARDTLDPTKVIPGVPATMSAERKAQLGQSVYRSFDAIAGADGKVGTEDDGGSLADRAILQAALSRGTGTTGGFDLADPEGKRTIDEASRSFLTANPNDRMFMQAGGGDVTDEDVLNETGLSEVDRTRVLSMLDDQRRKYGLTPEQEAVWRKLVEIKQQEETVLPQEDLDIPDPPVEAAEDFSGLPPASAIKMGRPEVANAPMRQGIYMDVPKLDPTYGASENRGKTPLDLAQNAMAFSTELGKRAEATEDPQAMADATTVRESIRRAVLKHQGILASHGTGPQYSEVVSTRDPKATAALNAAIAEINQAMRDAEIIASRYRYVDAVPDGDPSIVNP